MRDSLIRKELIKAMDTQVRILVYSSVKHFKVLCIIWLRISLAILKPLCLLCRTLISDLEPLMFPSDCNRTIRQPEISPSNGYPRRAPWKTIPRLSVPQQIDKHHEGFFSNRTFHRPAIVPNIFPVSGTFKKKKKTRKSWGSM